MTRYLLPLLCALAACAPSQSNTGPVLPSPQPTVEKDRVGVLVMAHGGSDEWNASVMEAVRPVSRRVPTEVALGMADPLSLAAALAKLRDSGVDRVAVVRMFLSGESFFDQTRFLLGLSDVPPQQWLLMGPARAMGTPTPIAHGLTVATHDDGLMQSKEAGRIMADRARSMAEMPGGESVLLLAHGMGDEAANDRVITAMERVAEAVSTEGFANVEVATLREDWDDVRKVSEERIRRFVMEQTRGGSRVLVLPFRLSGFGPYAAVLEGLDYEAGEGLLPHHSVADWVQQTAGRVACANGWGEAIAPCPRPVAGTEAHVPAPRR